MCLFNVALIHFFLRVLSEGVGLFQDLTDPLGDHSLDCSNKMVQILREN